jgi:hypothetical protein
LYAVYFLTARLKCSLLRQRVCDECRRLSQPITNSSSACDITINATMQLPPPPPEKKRGREKEKDRAVKPFTENTLCRRNPFLIKKIIGWRGKG